MSPGVSVRPMFVTKSPMFGGLDGVRAPRPGPPDSVGESSMIQTNFPEERRPSISRPSSPHPVVTDTEYASYEVQKSALWVWVKNRFQQ